MTYLGADEAHELDATGKTIRVFNKATMECGAFVAVRLPDGNTLISCGSDHRVIEVDPQDKIVWEANTKNVPFMNAFIAGIQRLPNGNTAMCNFFGEIGRDPGTPKCFEVTKDFKVVWQLKDSQDVRIGLVDRPRVPRSERLGGWGPAALKRAGTQRAVRVPRTGTDRSPGPPPARTGAAG